jgi:hypothetical protein
VNATIYLNSSPSKSNNPNRADPLTLLVCRGVCGDKSGDGWVGDAAHGGHTAGQPHDPLLRAEAVQGQLDHLTRQPQHDGMLRTQVLHQQRQDRRLEMGETG